jgi:hypothetical protein
LHLNFEFYYFRSQEKGLATKRAELLSENPIMPNMNVGSKLKAMLAETAPSNPRKKAEKSKGKWDNIMSQIAEGQKRSNSETKAKAIKEVKSKVFADFKPPKLIRHSNKAGSSNMGSMKKITRTFSERSNSTVSSNGLLDPGGHHKLLSSSSSRQSSVVVSRSGSSASVASQVNMKRPIDEDDDNVSECTLKDHVAKAKSRTSTNNGGKSYFMLFVLYIHGRGGWPRGSEGAPPTPHMRPVDPFDSPPGV